MHLPFPCEKLRSCRLWALSLALAFAALLFLWNYSLEFFEVGKWLTSRVDFDRSISLAFPAVIIVIGWAVGHRLSFKREVAAKRRETRLKVLESAFFAIHLSIGRQRTVEMDRAIEGAISALQLYGSLEQLSLVDDFINGMTIRNSSVPVTPLLIQLRNSIRDELGLATAEKRGIAWLRLDPVFINPRKCKIKRAT